MSALPELGPGEGSWIAYHPETGRPIEVTVRAGAEKLHVHGLRVVTIGAHLASLSSAHGSAEECTEDLADRLCASLIERPD